MALKGVCAPYKGEYQWVAGVDEVGRGPLAGPVVAAAVILDPSNPISGLTDSKKLSDERRNVLAEEIRLKATAWALGRAEAGEIDDINILNATMLAMQRAVRALRLTPDYALIDGNRCPELACPAQAIIKGDLTEPAISAASILAKVVRDEELVAMEKIYPGYGFAKHKGYPTREHIEALARFGVTAIHRRSFGPVKKQIVALDKAKAKAKETAGCAT